MDIIKVPSKLLGHDHEDRLQMVKREISGGFLIANEDFFQALNSGSSIKFKINGYVPDSFLATCSFMRRMSCKGLLQIFSLF